MAGNEVKILNQFCTHLVFADREMTPNLAPILDERFTVKRVLITYTANLEENAQRLKTIYNAHHIKADTHLIEASFEIPIIVEELQKLVQDIPYETLSINLSCANKLYTLGAFKAFENTPVGLYYLLPNDQFKWVQPSGLPEFNIAENMQLDEFLHAHGIEHSYPVKLTPSQANFANSLVNAIQKIILQQHALNTYQQFSTRFARGKSIKLIKHNEHYYLNDINNTHPHLKTDLLLGFLRKLHNQNVLHLKSENHETYPLPEKDSWRRTFFEGGWLEYYTYRTLLELKTEIEKIKEVAFGVKLQRENAYDEADVLFLANNQLFVVECKTGNNVNINLHLQRLDSLRNRLGGSTAHSLLITTEYIGANLPKANLLNVGVIDGHQLSHLKHHIQEWVLNEIAVKPVHPH
ncbi:Card1-like endonuclease domain-containing protein [Thiomicrorhabdus sp.]|uniref:Card1-like endonuclease domain-containing protein n=1 Tax=Thiomicrorhabdus sp. TaxID=2039724 RepID=UPI002AA6443C|nr:DUF1887 family CARF protein [Thiomicrorhabdus sp.]